MEWVKAFHVISVIAWMAAMLYLPRLFVYHADAEPGSEKSETFKIMERRLNNGILVPAMVASWVFGLWLAFGFRVVEWNWSAGWGWVWAKALFVIVLSGFHGLLSRHRKAFAQDRNTHSAKYFRMINEIPTLLMVGIVVFVIVRPF